MERGAKDSFCSKHYHCFLNLLGQRQPSFISCVSLMILLWTSWDPRQRLLTLLDWNITLPSPYVMSCHYSFLFMEIYRVSRMGSCQSHLLGFLWNGSASIITIIQHLWVEQLEDGTLGCRTQLRVSQSHVMDSSDCDGKNLLGKSQTWENVEY